MKFYIVNKATYLDNSVWDAIDRAGVTMRYISEQLGVNESLMSNIRSGKRVLSEKKYKEYKKKILDILNNLK